MNYRELNASLQRLIRFNSPFDKLERVYRETLTKHSIEPKINSRNFRNWEFSQTNGLFQHIWNESLQVFDKNAGYELNLYLAYEELKQFSAAEFLKNLVQSGNPGYYNPKRLAPQDPDLYKNVQFNEIEEIFIKTGIVNLEVFNNIYGFNSMEKLFMAYKMMFPLNIRGFLKVSREKTYALPKNIKRLIWLDELIQKQDLSLNDPRLRENLREIYLQAKDYRFENGALEPLELLILAEGVTEETLLPVFSEIAGIDFNKNGIKIISSGGKNQMLKLYARLSREINIPVLLIFDFDGREEALSLKPCLRDIDDIYIIQKGEFEDILPDSLVCKAVNVHYRLSGKINLCDIEGSQRKSRTFYRLWKEKGFGEFKKAEFARIIAANVNKSSELSEELHAIFEKVRKKLKTHGKTMCF